MDAGVVEVVVGKKILKHDHHLYAGKMKKASFPKQVQLYPGITVAFFEPNLQSTPGISGNNVNMQLANKMKIIKYCPLPWNPNSKFA